MPGPTPQQTIRLVDPDGQIRDVALDSAPSILQDPRWQVATHDAELERLSGQAREADYGGAAGTVKAGVAAVARGVTLGLSDVAARAIGGDQATIDLGGLREINPGTSVAGEIVGAIAPTVLSGGAALPAGAAAGAGRAIARAAGGGVRGAAAGGAVEGALFGAGQGVSELALSEDPITLERAAATLSSNVLFGAATGGLAAGGLKAAELGLGRAKGAIDDALARRRAAKTATPEEAIRSGDLSTIDKRILDTAEKSEIERLAKEQAPQRKALTDELDGYRKANRDAHDIRSTAGASDDPNLREAAGAFDRANLKLRAALDDKVGFAEDPLRSMKAVRTQAQALDDMRTAVRAQEQLWRAEVDAARQTFRADIEAISSKPTLAARNAEARARGLTDYTGPFTPAGLEDATDRAIKQYTGLKWGGAVRRALGEPEIVRRLPQIEGMIAANQRLLGQLDALAKPPTSELLGKIEEARAVLEVPKAPSQLGALVSAAVPFAGPLGAAVASGNRVVGSLRKVAAAAAERTGKAASAFLGGAGPAAGKAAKVAPVLATKTLAAVSYASNNGKRKKAPPATTLPALYKARTDEVKEQVHIAADGTFQMRPEARERMAARFDAMRAADPRAADQLETIGARRITYLASIIPRLPDYGTMQVGPERRQVPELEMRSWARAAAALEDPDAVFERAAAGTVTPEDVKALRAVYPEKLGDFIQRVVESLPTLQRTLPYKRRLALSILTGVPVDPAMTPGVLNVLQGMYASEPGTAGGTQAPTAQPQFGSVKADKGTPAQQRQGDEA